MGDLTISKTATSYAIGPPWLWLHSPRALIRLVTWRCAGRSEELVGVVRVAWGLTDGELCRLQPANSPPVRLGLG